MLDPNKHGVYNKEKKMDKDFNIFKDTRIDSFLAFLKGIVDSCLLILCSIGLFSSSGMIINNVWFVLWILCIFRITGK